jgi:hypothetical protein
MRDCKRLLDVEGEGIGLAGIYESKVPNHTLVQIDYNDRHERSSGGSKLHFLSPYQEAAKLLKALPHQEGDPCCRWPKPLRA